MKECWDCGLVYDGPFCPDCDDGGYADWLYENWKDKNLDAALEVEDPLTDYEKRINRNDY